MILFIWNELLILLTFYGLSIINKIQHLLKIYIYIYIYIYMRDFEVTIFDTILKFKSNLI
jgi:hypothetical protein